jgi:hypothetical protein
VERKRRRVEKTGGGCCLTGRSPEGEEVSSGKFQVKGKGEDSFRKKVPSLQFQVPSKKEKG